MSWCSNIFSTRNRQALSILIFNFADVSNQPQKRFSSQNLSNCALSISASSKSHLLPNNTTVGLASPLERAANKFSPIIACIDDSISVYKSLEKILTAHGYRSFGVQDPLKIIPSLIRNKPDLIFLDLVMPITNGYEVCEQIRKTPSLKHIPVIILTG